MTNIGTMNALAPTLRIGITGARDLRPDQADRVRQEIDAFLAMLVSDINQIAASAPARIYGDAGPAQSRLIAISPLAEGADRIFAKQAIAHGFSLTCPLPFVRDDYERDFETEESKHEFRLLLSQAGSDIIELDGARDAVETNSYEAVGRYVVRNCDILIAVWNGQAGRGFGGTADIVRFAANHGPPVWWIHSEQDISSSWLIDGQDFRQTAAETLVESRRALVGYLQHLLLPPSTHEEISPTVLERIANWRKPLKPMSFVMLDHPDRISDHWVWNAHGWLMKTVAGHISSEARVLPEPTLEPTAAFWLSRYQPGDSIAQQFARRYRSSYVWIFALAALALIFAAIAVVVPPIVPVKLIVTGTELGSLILIATLVVANERQAWHRKFLEFRLFAELCRKQEALAAFGWSLPGPSITDKHFFFRVDSAGERVNNEKGWVSWLFGALQRSAPLPRGTYTPARCQKLRQMVLNDLIEEQLHYHRARCKRSEVVDERLGRLGIWLFISVLLIVVIKLILVIFHANSEVILGLGLAAAILPALSAAFFGIRSYAELSALADQSRRMEGEMKAAKRRLERINLTEPLASQALASEVFDLATTMLKDIEGWVQIFRSKIVEPG